MLSGLPEGLGKLRFKTQATTKLLLELGRSRSAEWRFWEQLLSGPALGVRAWGHFAWLPSQAPSAWPPPPYPLCLAPLPHTPSACPPSPAPPLPAPLSCAPFAWPPLPNGSLGGPWLSLDTGPVWSVSSARVLGGYVGGDPGRMGRGQGGWALQGSQSGPLEPRSFGYWSRDASMCVSWDFPATRCRRWRELVKGGATS